MNPWWLFLLAPLYAIIGGFTGRWIYDRPGMLDSDNAVWFFGGLFWPVAYAGLILYFLAMQGAKLEQNIVPSSRRLVRNGKIARDEGTLEILDGKVVEDDPW